MTTALATASAAFRDVAGLHEPCACFGARLDAQGDFHPDEVPAIVEFKTSKQMRPTFALQLAGQALAWVARYELGQPSAAKIRRVCVLLRSDGTFDQRRDLHDCTDPQDFNAVMIAARHAWQRLRYGAQLSEDHAHALHRQDGVRVPGIGTVLKLGGYVDLRDIPPHILERARQVGEYVHQVIEWYEKGTLDRDTLDPQLALYLESYLRFRDATGFIPSGVEVECVYDCGRV
jgi:hypothetical protein